jgi:hypothetical protein
MADASPFCAHSSHFTHSHIGQAEAFIQGQWKFGKNRGALLIIYRPQINHLPTDFPYETLLGMSLLDRKVIVVDVVKCPAYALYLSQESKSQLMIVAIHMHSTDELTPILTAVLQRTKQFR